MPRRAKTRERDPKSLMRKVPLFQGLTAKDLKIVTQKAAIRTFPKETLLIVEGDTSTTLHIILKGRAIAVSIDTMGRQIIHNEFKEGDVFGEMSFLDGNPRCANVITKATTTVIMFERDGLEDLLGAHPQLNLRLIQGLLQKLRTATKSVEDLVFLDSFGRVTRLLTRLADDQQNINGKLTHQEIADRVGTSREMVSRILKHLVKSGYISRKKKVITIEKELPRSW